MLPDSRAARAMKYGGNSPIAVPAPCQQHNKPLELCSYNNNDNNNHDNAYGAVIMNKVIARVHLVHLMNVD